MAKNAEGLFNPFATGRSQPHEQDKRPSGNPYDAKRNAAALKLRQSSNSDGHRRSSSVSPLRKAMESDVNLKVPNSHDTSPVRDSSLLRDFQNLSKLNLKLEDKIQVVQDERDRYRVLYEQNEKELKIQRMTNSKLQDQNRGLERKNRSLQQQITKLDLQQQTSSGKFNSLNNQAQAPLSDLGSVQSIQQNTFQSQGVLQNVISSQREQIQVLVQEKSAQEQILETMYQKVQKLNEEISVLSRALDIKTSDMTQTLGFPVAKQQFLDLVQAVDTNGIRAHDATVYTAQINQLQKKLQLMQQENEDLKLIRESNNQELIELEQNRHNLVLKLQNFELENKHLNDEKSTLLEYVEGKDQNLEEVIVQKDKVIAQQDDQIRKLTSNINLMHEELNKRAIDSQLGHQPQPADNSSASVNQTRNKSPVTHKHSRSRDRRSSTKKHSLVSGELANMTKEELIERIELVEHQFERARSMQKEQHEQLQWLSDYYRGEIDQLKHRYDSEKVKTERDPYSELGGQDSPITNMQMKSVTSYVNQNHSMAHAKQAPLV